MLGEGRKSAWDLREKRSTAMKLGDYYEDYYRGYYAYLAPGTAQG